MTAVMAEKIKDDGRLYGSPSLSSLSSLMSYPTTMQLEALDSWPGQTDHGIVSIISNQDRSRVLASYFCF